MTCPRPTLTASAGLRHRYLGRYMLTCSITLWLPSTSEATGVKRVFHVASLSEKTVLSRIEKQRKMLRVASSWGLAGLDIDITLVR
jgi:hypothetical protein